MYVFTFLKRNANKLFYWFGWCIVMLFAAFPRFILEGDLSFLINNGDCQNGIISFVIPMTMIIVGYLLDVTYSLMTSAPSPNKMKQGFIAMIIFLSFSLLGIVFAMYFPYPIAKIICFAGTFFVVSALKWISLTITDKEVITLIKVD